MNDTVNGDYRPGPRATHVCLTCGRDNAGVGLLTIRRPEGDTVHCMWCYQDFLVGHVPQVARLDRMDA